MPRPFNIVKARNAVADARALTDEVAAKRHGVTVRTLRRWKVKLRALKADGPVDAFEGPPTNQTELTTEWRSVLRQVLRVGMGRLVEITAEESDPDKLSRTLERIANVEVVAEALGVGSASPSEDRASPEPSKGEGEGERSEGKSRRGGKRTRSG